MKFPKTAYLPQLTKFLSTVFHAGALLLVAGVAVLIALSTLPSPWQIEMKIVKSGSMVPNIPVGAVVIVRAAESYHVGDVITFGSDANGAIPKTHRIIEVVQSSAGTEFVTKGDANEDRDAGTTPLSEVLGRVQFSIPYAGYILAFSKQPLGFMLMIAVPAALIALYEIIEIGKQVAPSFGLGRKDKPVRKKKPVVASVAPPRYREETPMVLDLRQMRRL